MASELREVYVKTVSELAKSDPKVVVLEADLSSSIGTDKLQSELKDRYINVGIMEAEEIGVAAGISIVGFIPFIHSFGPFLTRRVFDQVFLSLGYSQRHAILVGTDPGVTAEVNGGTHMPFEDIALMRTIPNAFIYEPSTAEEFEATLRYAHANKGLHYIRVMRKSPPEVDRVFKGVDEGYSLVKEGTDGTIFACGLMVKEALEAAKQLETEDHISLAVIDLFKIKPLNEELVLEAAEKGPIITAENHNVIGGLGSSIAEFVGENYPVKIARIGVVEQFGQVGKTDFLIKEYELDSDSIYKKAKKIFQK